MGVDGSVEGKLLDGDEGEEGFGQGVLDYRQLYQGDRLTSSQLGIERSNGRIGDRCRLCLLTVSSSLRYGILSSRYQ